MLQDAYEVARAAARHLADLDAAHVFVLVLALALLDQQLER